MGRRMGRMLELMLDVDGALWVLVRHRLAGLAFKRCLSKTSTIGYIDAYLIALYVSKLQWKLG